MTRSSGAQNVFEKQEGKFERFHFGPAYQIGTIAVTKSEISEVPAS